MSTIAKKSTQLFIIFADDLCLQTLPFVSLTENVKDRIENFNQDH